MRLRPLVGPRCWVLTLGIVGPQDSGPPGHNSRRGGSEEIGLAYYLLGFAYLRRFWKCAGGRSWVGRLASGGVGESGTAEGYGGVGRVWVWSWPDIWAVTALAARFYFRYQEQFVPRLGIQEKSEYLDISGEIRPESSPSEFTRHQHHHSSPPSLPNAPTTASCALAQIQ